jgi:hypothetical protein
LYEGNIFKDEDVAFDYMRCGVYWWCGLICIRQWWKTPRRKGAGLRDTASDKKRAMTSQ